MSELGLEVTDMRLLGALQKQGQPSKTKLAEIVDLSPTPYWARLHRPTAAGLIRGNRADVALDRIGDFTRVVVTVALTHHSKADFERFETHIRKLNELAECIATGGGMD